MSTPLKRYGQAEGFTSAPNTRSSLRDIATPSTVLTNYTPDGVRSGEMASLSAYMGALGTEDAKARPTADDPFIDNGAAGSSFALSATAADYAPVLATAPPRSSSLALAYSPSSPATVIGSRLTKTSTNIVTDPLPGQSRYVKVSGPIEDEAGMTRIKDVKTMESSVSTKKLDDGSLIFRFDHVKEAQMACNSTRSLFNLGSFANGWSCTFAKPSEFHGDPSRDNEGQLKVAIIFSGEECSEEVLRKVAVKHIKAQAEVLNVETKSYEPEKNMMQLYIELASVRAAEALSAKCNRQWKPIPEDDSFAIIMDHNCAKFPMSSKPWVSAHSSAFRMAGMGNGPYDLGSPDKRDSKVDVTQIELGNDCRTTVMIRNIPNKVDADMFKTILDEHVFGRYDFSYLRIDFSNNCNVGYAFVNFKSPRDIITLYNSLVGKPWEVFSSDKIADVCYATNQGLGTCVEKFRNSSVMLEWPAHRPKLWHTHEDGEHLVGKEKPFPEPSNLQKLHRSRANATSIGLFPPRSLQVATSPFRGGDAGMPSPSWSARYGQGPLVPPGGYPMAMTPMTPTGAHFGGDYHSPAHVATVQQARMYNPMQAMPSVPVTSAGVAYSGAFRSPTAGGFTGAGYSPYGGPPGTPGRPF